jgi:Zn-dependent protease
MVSFTDVEIRHITISIFALAIAVSGIGFLSLGDVAQRFAAISIPLSLGFIAHELTHKYAAGKYGYISVFRMWPLGLAITLIVGLGSGGQFLFAAPGAVVILTSYFTPRQGGLISLGGPLMNVAIALCFLPINLLPGLIGTIGYWGARINLWLAFFNLIPIPPLDGQKVLSWNPAIWAAIEVPLLASTIVLFF